MRFHQKTAFEKYLKTEKRAAIYLVAVPSDFERKKTLDQILSILEITCAVSRFDGGSGCVAQILDILNTQSIFHGPAVVILDGVEHMKKGELEPLLGYIHNPHSRSILLLGTGSAKCASDVYAKGKTHIVAFDLIGEKPWERNVRMQQYLIDYARDNQQSLSRETALHILDQVGQDLSVLDQEMSKLVLFTKGRSAISVDDVRAICMQAKNLQSWDLVDQIVWQKGGVQVDPTLDLASLLSLIGQMRYQLQLGLQVAISLESNCSSLDIQSQFPQLRGAVLNQRVAFAKQQGGGYFEWGLHHLFKLELLAKNSSLKAPLLLDFFIFKLAYYGTQKTHPIASSQCFG